MDLEVIAMKEYSTIPKTWIFTINMPSVLSTTLLGDWSYPSEEMQTGLDFCLLISINDSDYVKIRTFAFLFEVVIFFLPDSVFGLFSSVEQWPVEKFIGWVINLIQWDQMRFIFNIVTFVVYIRLPTALPCLDTIVIKKIVNRSSWNFQLMNFSVHTCYFLWNKLGTLKSEYPRDIYIYNIRIC